MRKSYADRISMSTRKLREKVKFIHQVFLILVKIFFTTRGANVSSREFIFTHRLVLVNVFPGNIVCSLLISAIVRIFLSSLSLYFLFFTPIYYKYSYFFTERVWIFNQCLVFILCGSKKNYRLIKVFNFMIKCVIALICLLQVNHVVSKRQIPIGKWIKKL